MALKYLSKLKREGISTGRVAHRCDNSSFSLFFSYGGRSLLGGCVECCGQSFGTEKGHITNDMSFPEWCENLVKGRAKKGLQAVVISDKMEWTRENRENPVASVTSVDRIPSNLLIADTQWAEVALSGVAPLVSELVP